MAVINSVAQFFQKTFASISLAGPDHRWIIIGVAVLAVAGLVFSQEKHKSITILLGLYGIGLVMSYIPQLMQKYEEAILAQDRLYVDIIVQALPLIALLVMKYKKGKKRVGGPVS